MKYEKIHYHKISKSKLILLVYIQILNEYISQEG